MKYAMAFRFSEKAKENLATIVQVAGINQTAAIEMALAVLIQQLKGEKEMEELKKFQQFYQSRVEQALHSVQNGELTAEEAALCLAGAKLKYFTEVENRDLCYHLDDYEAEYKIALVQIESRLPNWNGLIIDRHI